MWNEMVSAVPQVLAVFCGAGLGVAMNHVRRCAMNASRKPEKQKRYS